MNSLTIYRKYTEGSEGPPQAYPEKMTFSEGNMLPGAYRVTRGNSTDPEKLKAISEWSPQINKNKLRCFLCLCIYYMWFISSFTDIAKSLTRLTEDRQVFQWPPEVEAAFQ
jgi:hypothetical protein